MESETKTINLATGQEIKEKPKETGVALIKSVMEIAIQNRKLIDTKKEKASATIKAVKSKIKAVETDAHDKYFNDLIVISNNTVGEMEKLRKEYTSKVNAWLKEEIAPENELKVEIAELVAMRNVRVARITEENAKKAKAIEDEKNKKLYEVEVKGLMKLSFEKGIIEKVLAFEKSIEEYFKNLTPQNAGKMKVALEGLKPNLKEEFFLSLFQVDFDPARMAQEDFDALVKRAKTFWMYEDINKKYQTECGDILKKWIDKIPQRVKELEIIAKGGEQGERVKKIVEEREKQEAQDFKKEVLTKLADTEKAVNNEIQGEQMSAEFQAQAQGQKIEAPSGTRQQKYFVIDNPGDTLQLSRIIGSIIIHMISHKSAEEKVQMVLQHGADGKPKVDKDGDPIYTPGVQFWLDTALTLGYTPDVKGLTLKYKTKTIAKKA